MGVIEEWERSGRGKVSAEEQSATDFRLAERHIFDYSLMSPTASRSETTGVYEC